MIRTLIVEDEEPAAARLEKLLKQVEPGIQILDVIDSVEIAVKWFETNDPPDLLMLDIQLADGLSFDIFKKTKVDSFVIFTTAYDEYAIKAFELNSIDYLLKPVDRVKLQNSIQKYRKLAGRNQQVSIETLMETLEHRKSSFKIRFAVNVGSKIISVETRSVAYFYSMEKSIFLCTNENHHYPLDFSLEHLEQLLDPEMFFRINRQVIIQYTSIEKIHILSRSRVKLETNPPASEDLLVSTARTHQFRLWLDR
ncbi:MAG: response regulator transcription factor [Bacteroidales bacterium]|nr:response regulator transcription factor [Bacteroidales bacterium]